MADLENTIREARTALADIVGGTNHVAQYAKKADFDPCDWNEDVRELEGWVPRQVALVTTALDQLVALLAEKDAEIAELPRRISLYEQQYSELLKDRQKATQQIWELARRGAEKDAQIEDLESRCAEKDVQIDRLAVAVDASDWYVQRLTYQSDLAESPDE